VYSQTLTAQLPAVEQHPRFSITLAFANVLMLATIVGQAFETDYPFFVQINRAVGISLIVVFLLFHFPKQLRLAPELWLLGLFTLWGLFISMPRAVDMYAAWDEGFRSIQIWALAFAVVGVTFAKRNMSFSFIIFIVCAAVLAIEGRITGDYALAMETRTTARVDTVVGNANSFGMLVLLGLMGLAYFWEAKGKAWTRLLILPVSVPLLLALVATGSRKSFALLAAFFLAWLWFCYGRQLRRKPQAIITIIIVLIGMGVLTSYMYHETYMGERFRESVDQGGLDDTRTGMYKRGFELFTEHPIAGIGLGQFRIVSGFGHYSHSDYIEILCSTGLVGFLLYFPIYVILLLRLHRLGKATTDPRIRYNVGLFKAIVLTILALGIGAPTFGSVFIWFTLASIIGVTYCWDRDRKAAISQPVRRGAVRYVRRPATG